MKRKTIIRVIQLLGVALLAMALLGAGEDEHARYNRLGHGMMCVCGCNQILLECNHVGCSYSETMTKQLKSMLAAGKTDEEIKAAFVQQYGVIVLAAPTNKGFDRVAWIMPFVIFGLGLGAVIYVVKTWKNRQTRLANAIGAAAAATAPEELDELRRKAREETEV